MCGRKRELFSIARSFRARTQLLDGFNGTNDSQDKTTVNSCLWQSKKNAANSWFIEYWSFVWIDRYSQLLVIFPEYFHHHWSFLQLFSNRQIFPYNQDTSCSVGLQVEDWEGVRDIPQSEIYSLPAVIVIIHSSRDRIRQWGRRHPLIWAIIFRLVGRTSHKANARLATWLKRKDQRALAKRGDWSVTCHMSHISFSLGHVMIKSCPMSTPPKVKLWLCSKARPICPTYYMLRFCYSPSQMATIFKVCHIRAKRLPLHRVEDWPSDRQSWSSSGRPRIIFRTRG